MIWLLVRVAIFIALLLAVSFGVQSLLDTPGGVVIAWNGRSLPPLNPLLFVAILGAIFVGLWLLFKAVGLLIAVVRFATGDETAISRFFNRSRQRRGLKALSDGMIAAAEGDDRLALQKTQRAAGLLDRPELTDYLAAQSAENIGDRDTATALLRDLAMNKKTRAIGLKGLARQAVANGEVARAVKFAAKALEEKPRDMDTARTLFELQTQTQDWAGARKTLTAQIRGGAIPSDVGKRRDAVLALAQSAAEEAEGNAPRALDAAIEAHRFAPALPPAATTAARLLSADGDGRGAERALRKTWKIAPHPDVAAAYAALYPDEAPAARRKRFDKLIAENPDHVESRLLKAELALMAEDFPAARAALGTLPEDAPTTRTLAIMAAVERGGGESEEVVRGWLTRALAAPRGERWACDNCGHVHGVWAPVCENCGAVDSLAWTAPRGDEAAIGADAALLPLVVGALSGGASDDDAEVVDVELGADAPERDSTVAA